MKLSTDALVLAPDAAIDLQTHTLYSDGTWTPEQLIDHLVSENFGLAAITDHDRVDTAVMLQQLALAKGLPLLVAVEISADWKGEPVDVLCFGFDPEHNELSTITHDILRCQQENTREVYANLRRNGVTIPQQEEGSQPPANDAELPAEVQEILAKPSVQHPHQLVALLKRHGYGTAEVSAGRMVMDAGLIFATAGIAAVVDATHRSGAVCLIAHPGRGDGYPVFDAAMLDQLRAETPIDGFEVYYPAHSAEQIAAYLDYAQKHNLLTSSGSDSHHPEKPPIKYRAELSRKLLERLGIQIS